jgi:hypothetical protein
MLTLILLTTFFAEPTLNPNTDSIVCLDDSMLDDDDYPLIFEDEPTLNLDITIDGAGGLDYIDVEDWISEEFEEDEVQVTLIPPSGWSLSWVRWPSGISNGSLPIEQPVESPLDEEEYEFTFRITNGGQSKSGGGTIKIKDGTGTAGTA